MNLFLINVLLAVGFMIALESFTLQTLVAGLVVPAQVAMLPLFLLLQDLGLVDTHLGLILVYAATGVPFSVFILTAYFRQLPVDLAEVRRGPMQVTIDADGKTRIAEIYEVAAPITTPETNVTVIGSQSLFNRESC